MTKDCLIEILSEAAVEIENAYGRDNVVAQRCRRVMQEIDDPAYWDKRVEAAKGRVPESAVTQ